MAFLIGGANSSAVTGYDIDNSLRVGNSHDLSRTFTEVTAERKKHTMSCWAKRNNIGSENHLLYAIIDGSNYSYIRFHSNNVIKYTLYAGGTTVGSLETDAVYRDPSAWYHVVLVYDSAQGTDTNRVKIYINNVQQSTNSETWPTLNFESIIGDDGAHKIGPSGDGGFQVADWYYIGNQALTPSSFGETDEDSGIWKPKEYSGTFGSTNDTFLEFKQSGTGTDSSGMGADTSGEDNHMAINNLAAIDQTTDTPTNNFCTMNPLDNYWANAALAEGNLQVTMPSTSNYYAFLRATMAVAKGKWYWEVKGVSTTDSNSDYGVVGFAHSPPTTRIDHLGRAYTSPGNGYGHYGHNGGFWYDGSEVAIVAAGDAAWRLNLLHFALDLDNNKIWWGIDGTWLDSGDPTSGATGTGADTVVDASLTAGGFYSPAIGDLDSGGTYVFSANFGNPAFAISSGNADDNGYGNFEFDVPTGFYALCSKNLAEFG